MPVVFALDEACCPQKPQQDRDVYIAMYKPHMAKPLVDKGVNNNNWFSRDDTLLSSLMSY